MLGRIFLLFTLVTLVELAILVPLSSAIGILPTLAMVVVTGLLGAWLAKREGVRVLSQAQQRLQRGEMPTSELLDGVCVLIAGAFLMTPGVLTDVVGFLLLTPAGRRPLHTLSKRWMERWLANSAQRVVVTSAGFDGFAHGSPFSSPPTGRGVVIDGGTASPKPDNHHTQQPVQRVYRDGDEVDLR